MCLCMFLMFCIVSKHKKHYMQTSCGSVIDSEKKELKAKQAKQSVDSVKSVAITIKNRAERDRCDNGSINECLTDLALLMLTESAFVWTCTLSTRARNTI